ncbi:CvpA family protein [Gorillibacterium timonense]|uniref:CvpA family protein n=1 Tax=Gorillibacterium timonense TaxID=1689269 RepID=UPI00071DDDCE|nr:CvpA family protein [Gorillibacterium timonense]
MNGIDATIGAILLLAFVLGWRRGLITQLISLGSLIIAWYAAYRLTPALVPHLESWLPQELAEGIGHYEERLSGLGWEQPLLRALAFILIVLAVKVALTIAGYLLNVIAKAPGLNGANRLAGAILALLEAAVLVSLIVYALSAAPGDRFREKMAGSQSVVFIMDRIPKLLDQFDSRMDRR